MKNVDKTRQVITEYYDPKQTKVDVVSIKQMKDLSQRIQTIEKEHQIFIKVIDRLFDKLRNEQKDVKDPFELDIKS